MILNSKRKMEEKKPFVIKNCCILRTCRHELNLLNDLFLYQIFRFANKFIDNNSNDSYKILLALSSVEKLYI